MNLTAKASLLVIAGASLVVAFGPVWGEDYLDFFDQGEFALRVHNWKRAVEFLDKAIEANPRFAIAYVNRAIAYSKMGHYDRSIADLKSAVNIDPNRPDVYGLMGLVYEIKKDYVAALDAYREALSRENRPAVRSVIERYIKDLEPKVKK
jgi:tetratricopeptide (TPR) repeat protein